MSSIYGHLWNSRHSTAAQWEITKQEWAQGLAGLSAEQIMHGLEVCRTELNGYGRDNIPTIAEFRARALGLANQRENAAAYRLFPPRAETKKATQGVAEQALSEIWHILGRGAKGNGARIVRKHLAGTTLAGGDEESQQTAENEVRATG
jgi:hypothetical protein